MLKKTITYTDFFDQVRTEDFYFNLSRAELVEMQFTAPNGDFSEHLQSLIDTTDRKEIMKSFKEIIVMSYGIRTEDGRYFEKSPEIAQRFLSSAAYSELLLSLLGEEDAMLDFIQGLVPSDLQDTVAQQAAPLRAQQPEMSARERSEAMLQGHRKPAPKQPEQAVKTERVVDPTSQDSQDEVLFDVASDPVQTVEVTGARPDLTSLSQEQLIAMVANSQQQQRLQ